MSQAGVPSRTRLERRQCDVESPDGGFADLVIVKSMDNNDIKEVYKDSKQMTSSRRSDIFMFVLKSVSHPPMFRLTVGDLMPTLSFLLTLQDLSHTD
jgi:hypothetical protein